MNADLFSDLLYHHGAKRLYALFEEVLLAADDGLAGAKNSVLALFDIAHELERGAVALLHVIFDFFFGARLRQHATISLVQAEGRKVVFIHYDDVFFSPLYESHIRFDQPCVGTVVSLSGARIE